MITGCELVERALEGLREVVVAHERREPHAFRELDRPHRLRVVADEDDQRAEPEQRTQPGAHGVDDLAQVERRRQRLRQAVQRDEQLVGGREVGGLVERGRPVTFDVGDEVAGERTERTAEEEDDGDLAGRAGVGLVDHLHGERGQHRHHARHDRADERPPAPHVAGEEESGDRREHERAREAAGRGAGGDGQCELEDDEHPQAGRGVRLELVDGLDSREHHERDGGEAEVVVLLAEEAEDDPGEDRHPTGRDGQPDEAVLDSGRGRVARGQRGRQTADSFGRFASCHSMLRTGGVGRVFTSGLTRLIGRRQRIPSGRTVRRTLPARQPSLCDPTRRLRGVLMVGLTGGIGSGKSTVAALLVAAGRGRGRRRRDRA